MQVVDKLLSNMAVDHSKKITEGLIGDELFPTVLVAEPQGKFQEFGLDASHLSKTDLAANGGQPALVDFQGSLKEYSCKDHALYEKIDKKKLRYLEGPFATYELNSSKSLTKQLLLARELKIKDKVLSLTDRSKTLSAAEKFSKKDVDPATQIEYAISQCAITPNRMFISESVYNALKLHPKLVERIGEITSVKKVTIESLQTLFDIEKVIIMKGKATTGNKKISGSALAGAIWGDTTIFAYVSNEKDEPCVGKTFKLKLSGGEYLVRKWDDELGGLEGVRNVQVGTSYDVNIVSREMIYSLKECV
ncbi:MAG: hypothetical protein ACRC5H_07610 [Treponemataceae bacterium]